MKTKRYSVAAGIFAAALVQFTVASTQAQGPIVSTNGDTLVINNFDTEFQVTNNGGFAWQNWYGTAYSNVVWSADDASNNPSSGCLKIVSYFPDAGVGGNYGSQFLAIDGYGPFNPGLAGNGAATNYVITNFTCDVRILPFSVTNSSGQYPLLEFGTMTSNYSTAFDFGTMQLDHTQTNWVHVNIPIAPSVDWVHIPGIFIKSYSSLTGVDIVEVDNIHLTYGNVPLVHPTVSVSKASSALRIFGIGPAGSYLRTYLATVDTSQSWVGGTYPVSYSFTVSGTDPNIPVNECHAYWLPLNTAATPLNQYSDYGSPDAMNLYIHDAGNGYLDADVAWKTNSPNANPNHFLVSVTNATMVGTWTVTFTSATDGTLTAPGVGTVAFTNTIPAGVATMFANPVVWMFGMQPDSAASVGEYIDVAHAQTVGVAAPISSDFTTGSIDTNVWLTTSVSSSSGIGLAPVNAANTPWWVSWSSPAVGFGLATKADLTSTIAWKTPNFYAGYPTNGPTLPVALDVSGPYVWELMPSADLPSVDGTSNGVKSANAFFRMQRPVPTQ